MWSISIYTFRSSERLNAIGCMMGNTLCSLPPRCLLVRLWVPCIRPIHNELSEVSFAKGIRASVLRFGSGVQRQVMVKAGLFGVQHLLRKEDVCTAREQARMHKVLTAPPVSAC